MIVDQILNELRQRTYVMLRPSAVAGVGVFAIRDIPKGCREMFGAPAAGADEYVAVPRTQIDVLPEHARHVVENYCLYDAEHYYVPADGFKKVDLVHFLNHSDTPNVVSLDEGAYFETLVDVPNGSELFVDYGTLVDEESGH